MGNHKQFFTKDQRHLLFGLLKGQIPARANGVKVPNYSLKISAELAGEGISYDPATVRTKLAFLVNDQAVWNAAYNILSADRPELLKEVMAEREEKLEDILP